MLSTGSRLQGRYRLRALIGKGSRKRVFRAEDPALGREVAVAVLETSSLNPDGRRRILTEARAMAGIGLHPNVVPILDLGEHEGQIYLVMEWLEGGDLAGHLASFPGGHMTVAAALELARQLAGALGHAHGQALIHRDLNPGNVWLTRAGDAKVGDFGLSASLPRTEAMREGSIAAVSYLAPEQAFGGQYSTASDLYALGAVLYHALTGQPPFLGDNAVAVLAQHLHNPPVPPRWHSDGIPVAFEALVLQLLEKEPERRPASAKVVSESLDSIVLDGPVRVGAGDHPVERLAPGLFIGREALLEDVRSAINSMLQGQGSTVLLAGEPGIGKSRTLDQIATYARLRGLEVLRARAFEDEHTPGYWIWIQVLRDWLRAGSRDEIRADARGVGSELATLVPSLREILPEPGPPGPLVGTDGRFRLLDAVATVLRRASERQPLVILLDDLQASDAGSLMLLRFLQRELAGTRSLVVGAYRDSELRANDATTETLEGLAAEGRFLALGGWDTAEVQRFIELSTGRSTDDREAAAIRERTAGNPLFVTELVRLMATGEDAGLPDPSATAREGLRHAIGRRLVLLSSDLRDWLRTASVLGREFSLMPMRLMLGEAFLDRSDEAIAARVVERTPAGLRFLHGLVRDALYEETPAAERERLHARAGRAIEAHGSASPDERAAALAHHFARAGKAGAAEAVRYARIAAERAFTSHAYDGAVRFTRTALEMLGGTGMSRPGSEARILRAELLVLLGDALWSAGENADARTAFAEALELARGVEEGRAGEILARAAFGYAGRTDAELNPDPEVLALLEEGLSALGERDSSLRARLAARTATALYFVPDRERGERLAREAVAIAQRLGDEVTEAYCGTALRYVLWRPGTLAEREEIFRRTSDLARRARAREAEALAHYGAFADSLEAGRPERIEANLARHAALAHELDQPFFVWQSCAMRATYTLLRGDLEAAEREIEHARLVGEGVPSPNPGLLYGGQLFFLRFEQGRLSELEPVIAAMRNQVPDQPIYACGLMRIHAASGRSHEAAALLEALAEHDFARVPFDLSWLSCLAMAADVCVELENRRVAERVLEKLEPHADSCASTSFASAWQGSIAHYLGRLAGLIGDVDGAHDWFESALAVHTRMGARRFVARSTAAKAALPGRTLAPPVRTLPRVNAGLFRREGDRWRVRYRDHSVFINHSLGMDCIRSLLDRPEHEIHALDLVRSSDPRPAHDAAHPGSGLPASDARARDAYRARLAELRADLDDAEGGADPARSEAIRSEVEQLEEHLLRVYGAFARVRSHADPSERARKAVYNRIRAALRKLDASHPELARHLDRSIRTGTTCVYHPEQPLRWD